MPNQTTKTHQRTSTIKIEPNTNLLQKEKETTGKITHKANQYKKAMKITESFDRDTE